MNGAGRRTRFEERVRLEREFLQPVNAVFGRNSPLAGMTADAIASWEKRASDVTGKSSVGRIALILREASRRAELLADNSRDVFEPGRRVSPDGLGDLKLSLDEALASGA